MGTINVLSFAVANLIAAGEVVDRPASVIKELMENAIDAGATRITVEIQNGGVRLMRVTDNGCGISPEDLPVAIRRHATSKIKDAGDLDGILTLGFRGEALAAIASVSDLRILSKTPDAEFGALLQAHGGEQITVTEQGCSTGTTVIVENLFANVPARRKFLKKDVTESMAVTVNVEKLALSNPDVAIRLLVDGNVKTETAGDGNLKNTVYALYGKEFASRLIEVQSEHNGIEVRGFIGRTDNFKANRNFQNFFVNSRFVKSKTAMAALEQAYTSYLPPEKFPCCVLHIDVNPARVDVNVHPAKLEVKFSDEKAIFEAVYYTVRTALEGDSTRPAMQLDQLLRKSKPGGARMSDAIVPVENSRPEAVSRRQLSYDLAGNTQWQPEVPPKVQESAQRMSAAEYRNYISGGKAPVQAVPVVSQSIVSQPITIPEKKREENAPAIPVAKANIPQPPKPEPQIPQKPLTTGAPKQVSSLPPKPQAADLVPHAPTRLEAAETDLSVDLQQAAALPYRIVGEVFHSYVIVEVGDKMLIVDQHAAHERILFEQLKAGLQNMTVTSQMLMLPVEVMMTSAEVEVLREYEGELQKIGFSLRYARNTVSADAIPEGVETAAVESMLQTMAGRLLDNTGSVKLTRDIIFEKALYQAACKAAIKAGREYAPEHIEWLIKQLMALPDITFCPHGRPVAMEISHHTLDRQFDRTGF